MFKVNNRKTINNIVKSNIKKYKMRNLFTLIAIVLSVSLISGLGFFSIAIQEIEHKELAKRQHVIYYDLTEEQIYNLKSNDNISASSEFKRAESFEVDDYIILPSYMEDKKDNFMNLELIEGIFPQKIDDIVVDKNMLLKMNIDHKLGEKVKIKFLDNTVEEFNISGIVESETDNNVFQLYLSREYALKGSQLKEISFSLAAQISGAEKLNTEEFLSLIHGIGEENKIESKNINENDSFVDSLTYSARELLMIVLIGFIILLISVLVIYSIFYISISERTREFGQLRLIGMTKKQIKKVVKKEGAILSIVASIIGILLAGIFTFIIKPEGFNFNMVLIYSVAIIVANYITVQFSIYAPAKYASSISPIEAYKTSGYEIKSKRNQTKKLMRKLSPLSLSIISAQENYKKSIMTIISISLAGIVFMSSSTFLVSINEEEYSRQGWFKIGDFIISLSQNAIKINEHGVVGIKKSNPLSEVLINQLEQIEGVKEVIPFKDTVIEYNYNNTTSKDIVTAFTNENVQMIKKYIKEGNLDYNQMIKNKEIIIVHNKIAKEIFGWKFNIGDEIYFNWYDGEKYVQDQFKITAILQDDNILYRDKDMYKLAYSSGWFLMPFELLEDMMLPDFNLNSKIMVKVHDYEKDNNRIKDEIVSLIENKPLIKINAFSDNLDQNKKQYDLLYGTFMAPVLFIIAFSLINLLNTLISSAVFRKKEFAYLGAIGASKKQIKTMILGEGMFFSIINLVITTIIGSVVGYILVKVMIWNGMEYLEYKFPTTHLILYGLFLMIIPVLLSTLISKIINKKSLVERIRDIE